MRKWILRVTVVGVAAVIALLAAGMVLPRAHVAASGVTLRQRPESVWAAVRDLGGVPRWWPAVTSATRVADPAGREVWRQEVDGFSMTFVVTDVAAPARLVTTIEAPPGSAFGGTWTYELSPADGGTRVSVTESGWIANPLFRVMAHLGGFHRTLDGYLTALGAHFGEAVSPEHVVR